MAADVLDLALEHAATWHGQPDEWWAGQLAEELAELCLSLGGLHGHSPELELREIAAIAINWQAERAQRLGEAINQPGP